MIRLYLIMAGTWLLALITPARADVVYTTFGPGDSFSHTSGYIVTGADSSAGTDCDIAMPFTPLDGEYTLTTIDVALRNVEGGAGVDVMVWTNSVDQPGTIIASTMALAPAAAGIVPSSVPGDVTVSQGTTYWVVLSSDGDSFNVWYANSIGIAGPKCYRENGGAWNVVNPATYAAFRVNGIPEPNTLLLALSGLMVLWRRRQAGEGTK